MTEEQFLGAIRDCAHRLGWATYHTHDSRRSEHGFPDLVLVRGTRLVFAEVKTDRGHTTLAQDDWLEALRAAGAETHVWRPLHWDSIVMTLRARERAQPEGAPA